MLSLQAQHNVLMHPFHEIGVAGIFGGAYHFPNLIAGGEGIPVQIETAPTIS